MNFIAALSAATSRWWVTAPLVVLLLLGHHFRDRFGARGRGVWLAFTLLLMVSYAIPLFRVMQANITRPGEWDFHLYWVYGRAAVLGLNPYDPENLRRLAASLNPSAELLAELYFFQAPPALFLFVPLGWFDVRTAYVVWYGVQLLAFAADVWLLRRLFLPREDWAGMLLPAVLLLMLRATLSTFGHGQINFIVLLCVLLMWRARERPLAGVWLALGVFVKPLLVFVYLYPLARRQWKALLVSGLMMLGASLVTILGFGPQMFFQYFTANPIANSMPDYLYTELVNQSLLATLLRATAYPFSGTGAMWQPLFLVSAISLTCLTGALVLQRGQRQPDWALALTLGYALLLFPKTLEHYAVLLIAPLMLLWARRAQWVTAWGAAALAAIIVALADACSGELTFLAFALSYGVCGVMVLWTRDDLPKTRLA
jgi:hypothetical protein